MKLSSSKIKKFPIFSQKEAFLIFQEMELFRKTSYILEGTKKIKTKNKNKKLYEKIS